MQNLECNKELLKRLDIVWQAYAGNRYQPKALKPGKDFSWAVWDLAEQCWVTEKQLLKMTIEQIGEGIETSIRRGAYKCRT